MKRIIFIPCCVAFLSAPALGAILHASDLVDRIEARYRQSESLEAKFTQETYIEILNRKENRSGRLYMTKDKFRIDYTQPSEQSYIYDGKTLWIYTPAYKEVEIYENASARISREALTFLSGLNTLREEFRIPETRKHDTLSTLTLVPKDPQSGFTKIELSVAQSSLDIKKATLWPKQGNRTDYQFVDVTSDKEIEESLFTFKRPRDVKERRPDA